MRTWLVTVRDGKGKFIDQREIKSQSQVRAESDFYDWVRLKEGSVTKSTIEEVT
jgi:hypothetical protein